MLNPVVSAPTPGSTGDEAGAPATFEDWIRDHASDIKLPREAVCEGHHSPWECLEAIRRRPSVALILGSRGSGKSFLSALDTHLTSREHPKHGTRILGGSKAQSEQIYRALRDLATDYEGEQGSDAGTIAKLRKEGATYANGSEVSILAASPTSVRGPHVPSLKLDEVDEMDTDIRESAMGMCMGSRRIKDRAGLPASVIMTSTCHRVNGPMAGLIKRAEAGDFPLYTMCVFEVLERCPDERSGPNLENCPDCPLSRYCRDVPDGVWPKAKRSDGHYPIDSLIQKMRTTGVRTFEADYLCLPSPGEGAWFKAFTPESHVSEKAEFLFGGPVHLAVDSGVFTGAVLFQVVQEPTTEGPVAEVRIFADYLAEGLSAESNAKAILKVTQERCLGILHHATTDPAGKSRTSIGPTVLGEYMRAHLKLDAWPLAKVADSLALLDSFINPADGTPRLLVHPRCKDTILALQGYRRAKRGGQWLDFPADPQHPHEDLVDALRGGLTAHYPEGRNPKSSLIRVKATQVF